MYLTEEEKAAPLENIHITYGMRRRCVNPETADGYYEYEKTSIVLGVLESVSAMILAGKIPEQLEDVLQNLASMQGYDEAWFVTAYTK